MCLPPAPLLGRRVRIHGLSGRPELNGKTVSALFYDAAKDRHAVKLPDGKQLLLRAANLVASKELPPLPMRPRWRPGSDEEIRSVWHCTVAAKDGGGALPPIARSDAWRNECDVTPPDGARWDGVFCGGRVKECDMRTEAGLQAACDAVAARVPVLMRHANDALAPSVMAALASADNVGALVGKDLDLTVLRAGDRAKDRYTYYHATHGRPPSDARFARSDARSDSNLARSDARSDSNLDATSRSRAAAVTFAASAVSRRARSIASRCRRRSSSSSRRFESATSL